MLKAYLCLFVENWKIVVVPMVLKTGTVKEPENVLITDGRTDDVINNLIIIYLNYINN